MRILVVCLGNICRSPTAEAALREAFAHAAMDHVEIESAGTGNWHVGSPPDARMTSAAADVDLVLDGQARQFTPADFDAFDLILVMDETNLADVGSLARDEADRAKVRLFREFEEGATDLQVPDPYYGGAEGFAEVVRIARAAAEGVAQHVRRGAL